MSMNEIGGRPDGAAACAAFFGRSGYPLETAPQFIETLPIAIYACDARGRVLWFNRLAAELWGRAPRVGDDTEQLCRCDEFNFEGQQIGPSPDPMVYVLKTGIPVHGAEGALRRWCISSR